MVNKFDLGLLFLLINISLSGQIVIDKEGAMIRSDTTKQSIYLCFTGHEYVDGFKHVASVLNRQKVKGSFFLTGDFVRNHRYLVDNLAKNGHYIGAHSDKHLLYCDWSKRDSLLHSERQIKEDILQNLKALKKIGILPKYFMPPYEWYNKEIVKISSQVGQTTINFSPGTLSNADYTTSDMPNYVSSSEILESIYNYQSMKSMNGFHLLIHPGTNAERTDKFYLHLDSLIDKLKKEGYQFLKF